MEFEKADDDCIIKWDDGLEIIGILLAVVCALLWFQPAVRAQGANRRLERKDYLRIALLFGLLCSCVPIIVSLSLGTVFFTAITSPVCPARIVSRQERECH